MATTVIGAFDTFLANTVNLDKNQTARARASRAWLLEQIHAFPDNAELFFPKLYVDADIFFGSFERKTKIRELDDIDIIVGISAESGSYNTYADRIEIKVQDSEPKLKALCNNGTNILNSRMVINKFIAGLKKVPNYSKSDIHRQQEAATLNLLSYPWTFDIVPGFLTHADALGKTYFLIPDGNGHWKKTDPRMDRDRTTKINVNHDGNVLNVIRAVKYWNRRPTMPCMGSYLIENMILNYYAGQITKASKYVDIELVKIFGYLQTGVYNVVLDPKGIQGDLNTISIEDRVKISTRATNDYNRAQIARYYEQNKDFQASIKKWGEIFGDRFPTYG